MAGTENMSAFVSNWICNWQTRGSFSCTESHSPKPFVNKWSLVTPGRCCEANSGGIIQRILVVSWPSINLFEPLQEWHQHPGQWSLQSRRCLAALVVGAEWDDHSRWWDSFHNVCSTNNMCIMYYIFYTYIFCLFAHVYGRQLFLACNMRKVRNPTECTNNVQTEATNKCTDNVIEGSEATCPWYTARMRFLCHSTFVHAWKNHSLWIFCEGCVVSRSAYTKTIAKMKQC